MCPDDSSGRCAFIPKGAQSPRDLRHTQSLFLPQYASFPLSPYAVIFL